MHCGDRLVLEIDRKPQERSPLLISSVELAHVNSWSPSFKCGSMGWQMSPLKLPIFPIEIVWWILWNKQRAIRCGDGWVCFVLWPANRAFEYHWPVSERARAAPLFISTRRPVPIRVFACETYERFRGSGFRLDMGGGHEPSFMCGCYKIISCRDRVCVELQNSPHVYFDHSRVEFQT